MTRFRVVRIAPSDFKVAALAAMPSQTPPQSTVPSDTTPRASGRSFSSLDRELCTNLDQALGLEWLLTDGCGGYASSTVVQCPTRKYHGLLVAPPASTAKRYLFLSRYEEHLVVDGHSFPLSIARYEDLWSPEGHLCQESFDLVPFPSSLYRIGEAEVRREILMPKGRHAVLVKYSITGVDEAVELQLRPLLPFREADALTVENTHLNSTVTEFGSGFSVQPYDGLPGVSFSWTGSDTEFESDSGWFNNIEYSEEIARGYPGREDQWCPGIIKLRLEPKKDVIVACAMNLAIENPAELWDSESERQVREAAAVLGDLPSRLALTADAFIYRATDGRPGIMAGFPWFLEWGRDTYIALPGLTLARGKRELCGEILAAALPFLRDGLLPNIFANTPADSHYGSADAALWYARAVRAYDLAGASEEEILERYLPALTSIAVGYRDGTGLGIKCDESGLPRMGSADLNATWMDAVTEFGPVTPRHGFPVETCALYYFLLAYLEDLNHRRGDLQVEAEWREAKRLAGRAFMERFWIEDQRYLADVWDADVREESVRPNMVIAAALEFSPLTREQRTDVVQRAELELLTSRGLRTLSPKHADYIGHYGGTPLERDGAYHQGTVWPWLLGFFTEAWLRSIGTRVKDLRRVREVLDGFEEHMNEAGLLQCSEVFDGDPPHTAGGSIAQAWSTSELLRAFKMVEERKP
ncbi:MAG: putative glycogen debranching enzyme [Planctomycetota bacterium]|jgi:predicted glycogen debranching enzyme